jgi:hypothetical protein
MSKDASYYVDHPEELDALLAKSPAPIPDQMAISILKNPLVQAYIAKAIVDAAGSPS